MFENVVKFLKKFNKKEKNTANNSKDAAKERLHLVLMQDRANVSADFLELMKQEIIEVIKKYIEVDEGAIDVRLTNKENEDGTNGAPALYANIPILNIKNEARKVEAKDKQKTEQKDKINDDKNKEEKQEVDRGSEDKNLKKRNMTREHKIRIEQVKQGEGKKHLKQRRNENAREIEINKVKNKNNEVKEETNKNNGEKEIKIEKREKIKTEE